MSAEPFQRPRPRTGHLYGPLLVVVLFLLSSLVLAPPSGTASASTAPHRASDAAAAGAIGIAGAERSLALGNGPAQGQPMECSASDSLSSRCAPATATSRAPAVVPAGTTSGNAGWLDLSPSQTTSPGPTQMSLMSYLPSLGGVVLVGGYGGFSNTTQTWLFKNGQWSDITSNVTGAPAPRWAGGLVYDAADGYLLLFGGRDATTWYNDTWTFNGTTWSNLGLAHSPATRAYFTMVYDPTDAYVVVFSGGCWCGPAGARIVYNDTWTYAGGAWTNITATLSAAPPLLAFYPGAWDAHDGYMIVFGGNDYGACGGGNLTWTFVGGVWTNRTTASNAPPSMGGNAAFAYDPIAGEVVFFGGAFLPGCSQSAETWIYTNGTWWDATNYLGGTPPAPSSLGPMTWDDGDGFLLLYGGVTASGTTLGGTFALYLNGTFLVRATASPTGGPKPLLVHFVASAVGGLAPYNYTWDPGDGSANATGAYFNHTYTKSGMYRATVLVNDSSTNSTLVALGITVTSLTWYDLPSSATQPPWLYMAAMTYDPQINGILLFGGNLEVYPYGYSDQTWEYVGGVWTNISSNLSQAPSSRFGASLAYDINDSYALLYGGYSTACTGTVGNFTSYYFCNDTWIFTPAAGWVQINPNISPPARYAAAMADDPIDGYVVLFGGECYYCGGSYYSQADDTWIFHGGQWINWTSNTTKSPNPLVFTDAVFDAAEGYVLMFGGGTNGCPSGTGQTWTFSHGNWTDETTGTQPTGTDYGAMAYDSVLGKAVFFGGYAYSSSCNFKIYNETWTYSNGTWTDATSNTIGAPPEDEAASMAYDDAAGAVVFLGDEGLYYTSATVQPCWTWPGRPLVTTAKLAPFEGISPFNVTLSANTTGGVGPYNDSWDFGDGTPNATGSSVTHEFSGVANYTVTLTANDSGGRISIVYLSVVGYQHLLSDPTTTTTMGEVAWPVHFYSNATGGVPPLTRSWSFGDGATSTAPSPLHTYTIAGNYTAKLTIRDSSGIAQNYSFPIVAIPRLAAVPSESPPLGQTPLTVNFTAGDTGGLGPYSFNWSFGDGTVNGTVADPSHVYPNVGTFKVGLVVSDRLGYTAHAALTVTVTQPLVASPAASPTNGLGPLEVTFIDGSTGGSTPYVVSWNYGDGTPLGSGVVVDHLYSLPGVYTAVESVTDAVGTVAQHNIVITVAGPLTSTLSDNASLVVGTGSVQFQLHPNGGEVPYQYSYRFGDGGTSSGSAIANHTFVTIGTFEIRGTVTDGLHQASTATANVTVVAPLVARISVSPQTLVLGGTLNLTAGSGGGTGPYVYSWTGLPTGCVGASTIAISCVPTAAKNYTISVTIGDRSRQNSTASTWVLVTTAPSGSGGAGSGSGSSGGSLLWLALAIVAAAVVVGLVLVLRRRGAPPTEPENPEEPAEPAEWAEEPPPADGATPADETPLEGP